MCFSAFKRPVMVAIIAFHVFAPADCQDHTSATKPDSTELIESLSHSLKHLAEFAVTRETTIQSDDYGFLNPGLTDLKDIRFKSTNPITTSGSCGTHLRFRLRIMNYENDSAAHTAWQALFSSADPNIGLTYAWDQVIQSGTKVLWLNAPCLLSEENWEQLKMLLTRHPPSESQISSFECQCGQNCKRLENEPSLQTQEVRFRAGDIELAGTLLIPDRPGPKPAVVLISGGGPHDRDGSYGEFKPMKMLAEHLAQLGIVTLRYDDPGVGLSGGKDVMQYLMKDYVAFVSSGVSTLRESPHVDASRIGLLGLSQGASVATELAAVDPKIAFIVLLSCHAVPGDRLFFRYQRFLGKQQNKTQAQLEEIERAQKVLFDCLRQDEDCAQTESQMRSIIETEFENLPSEQKPQFSSADAYLQTTFLGATMMIAHTPNFLEILDYSILPALGQVRCPTFIVFGEREEFIDVDENLELVEAKLKSAGISRYDTEVIPNATHLFLDVENPSFDFAPGLLPSLTKWFTTTGYVAQ